LFQRASNSVATKRFSGSTASYLPSGAVRFVPGLFQSQRQSLSLLVVARSALKRHAQAAADDEKRQALALAWEKARYEADRADGNTTPWNRKTV